MYTPTTLPLYPTTLPIYPTGLPTPSQCHVGRAIVCSSSPYGASGHLVLANGGVVPFTDGWPPSGIGALHGELVQACGSMDPFTRTLRVSSVGHLREPIPGAYDPRYQPLWYTKGAVTR